jgi:non-specific serine/threonine protein kinase
LLLQLVDKSLVIAEPWGHENRYRLLETIRQYADEKLREAAEAEDTRDRHRDYFATVTAPAWFDLEGPRLSIWLDWLETESDNLRAALEWCASSNPATGLQLAGALWRFWRYRSRFAEGRRWLETFLTCVPAAAQDQRARGFALVGAGELAVEQGDRFESETYVEEAARILRTTESPHELAVALHDLSFLYLQRAGDLERARLAAEESLVAARAAGNQRDVGTSMEVIGMVAGRAGDLDRAGSLFDEALRVLRAAGDPFAVATLLWYMGQLAQARKRLTLARQHFEEAMSLFEKAGLSMHRDLIILGLAWLVASEGDVARARELLTQSILPVLHSASGYIADAIVIAGLISSHAGFRERGIRLFAAAKQSRSVGDRVLTIDVDMFDVLTAEWEHQIAAARADLGVERFDSAWAEGQLMTQAQAVAYALQPDREPD